MKPSKNLTVTRRKAAKVVGASGAVGVLGLSLGSIAPSCLNRPIDVLDTRTTSTVVERLQQNGVDKIDLLLAIDNSISMGDKQQILAAAVPDLVNRLVTPNCVDDTGAATGQTVDAGGECPDGSAPEFPPIRNINVGIISSSLGDLTSEACSTVTNPDDKAHLLSRVTGGGDVNTFEGKGFLAWDPDNKRGGETNAGNLSSDLSDMVKGVNQVGCGYEMQLESVLRFLVDPAPYASLQRNDDTNKLDKVGVDEALLAQRKDFLRPDSLLAILLLSDENDCSVDVTSQGFLVLEPGAFYRSTSACKDDPMGECCTSCALNDDAACDPDNECSAGPNGGKKYSDAEDPANLSCFNQKERYGVNFLYPVKRYVNAFTQPKINPGARDYSVSDAADAVVNPIFDDLQETGLGIRSPDLVFVAGIVGVPWQAISRKNESGEPDLSLGFQTFDELQGDLAALVGNPDRAVYPTDPFMVESVGKRSGTSAIMGVSIDGPGAPNGGEYTVDDNLQFACVFPLVTPNPTGSDCADCGAGCDNPLCDGTTQVNAKAYPGLRELSLLEGMGTQGIFGSICPAEVSNTNSPIYGYRPAVNTIIDRLKTKLGGQCLPRKLTPDPDTGRVQCLVIEASATGGGACCETAGRAPIPEQVDGAANPKYAAVTAAKEGEFANENWDCFCELEQLTGEELVTCQENTDPQAGAQGDGWCYIDGTEVPPVGNPELVQGCPADERRLVRFVGDGDPITGATVFVTCSGE